MAESGKEITESSVAQAMEQLFLGEQGYIDTNLKYVRDQLLQRTRNVRKALEAYQEILSGKQVDDDERSLPLSHLKMSGVVLWEDGHLIPRNRIYQQVFNQAWVEENMPRNVIWKRLPLWARAVAITCLLEIVITAPVIISRLPSILSVIATPTQALPIITTSTQTTPIAQSETSTLSVTPTGTPESRNTPTVTFTAAPITPTTLPIEITDAIGVLMRLAPEGEFTMGSYIGYVDELPLHTVYLDAFYMDEYEVTIAAYQACVDAGACSPPQDPDYLLQSSYYTNPANENHPIVFVDWYMAQAYCEWRGARLPTEAEWEKAAGGTDGRTYPRGEDIRCGRTNYYGCVKGVENVGSHETGKSPYGIYDMAGNVWEWVADWYDVGYYADLETGARNPPGSESGTQRVLRGGS